MHILNKRPFHRIQKYCNNIYNERKKIIKQLNNNYKYNKLYEMFGCTFANDYLNSIHEKITESSTFNEIITKSQTIIHNSVRFNINTFNSGFIKKITWDIDESLINKIEIIIGGSCIERCYQPYFENLRKIHNIENNSIPLYIINGLINTKRHEQSLYVHFKNNAHLPQSMTINIHTHTTSYYENFIQISQMPLFQYPIYQTINRRIDNGNFLLDKILIPLNITSIIFEIDDIFNIELNRLDYFNNKSLFSFSEYYQSDDLIDYVLSLSRMRKVVVRNKNNNSIIDTDICYIIVNIIAFMDNMCGLRFAD